MEASQLRLIRMLTRAYNLAKKLLLGYFYPHSPHLHILARLGCCVLLKIYRNTIYQEIEEQICVSNLIQQTLELSRVPGHTTIYRMMGKL